MESVQIRNRDMAWHIAANILFPPNFDAAKSWPAIIAVHPFGSCKEQTSGNVYGKALANRASSSSPMTPASRALPVVNRAGSRIRPSGSRISAM